MHGLPRRRVEQVIAAAGGRLVAAEPDRSPGPRWVSWMYYATAAAAAGP
jgi:hypothetical protein